MPGVRFWCATLLVSAVARAQDIACTPAPAAGQVSVVIMGRLEPMYPTVEVPTPYLRSVLFSLRDSFRAAGPLTFAAFTDLGPDTVTFAMSTAVMFQITRDGRIEGSHLLATSLSPSLDSAVLGAVARVDSGQLLLPLPRGVDGRVHLRFTTYVATDTGQGTSGHDVTGPLVRTSAPVWTSFKMPGMIPHLRLPAYPGQAVMARAEDSVTAAFVLDETGAVLANTVYLTKVTYRDFGISVIKWLYVPQPRYQPGIVGGCPSKFFVVQPFWYQIERH
jgi:hypothetical protein